MGRNSGGVRTATSKRNATAEMRREVLARSRKRYADSRWWANPPSWSGVMREQWNIVATNARMRREREEYERKRSEEERKAITRQRRAWAKMSASERLSYSMGYGRGSGSFTGD